MISSSTAGAPATPRGLLLRNWRPLSGLREAGVAAALLFVVGEERDSAGARMANLHPKGSRFLINGEPTDNRLALASKGALRAEDTRPRHHGPLRLSGVGR